MQVQKQIEPNGVETMVLTVDVYNEVATFSFGLDDEVGRLSFIRADETVAVRRHRRARLYRVLHRTPCNDRAVSVSALEPASIIYSSLSTARTASGLAAASSGSTIPGN